MKNERAASCCRQRSHWSKIMHTKRNALTMAVFGAVLSVLAGCLLWTTAPCWCGAQECSRYMLADCWMTPWEEFLVWVCGLCTMGVGFRLCRHLLEIIGRE